MAEPRVMIQDYVGEYEDFSHLLEKENGNEIYEYHKPPGFKYPPKCWTNVKDDYCIFDDLFVIEEEAKNMPEYLNENLGDTYELIVKFETEEDFRDFVKKMDREDLTIKSRHMWYPKRENIESIDRFWIEDEE